MSFGELYIFKDYSEKGIKKDYSEYLPRNLTAKETNSHWNEGRIWKLPEEAGPQLTLGGAGRPH